MKHRVFWWLFAAVCALLALKLHYADTAEYTQFMPWNYPHVPLPILSSSHPSPTVAYYTFSEPPKTLDPARAYSANEGAFIYQIYEPVLQYHYLKKSSTLSPLTATALPDIVYRDAKGHTIKSGSTETPIAYTDYIITIKPGIFFAPHPAFSSKNDLTHYHTLSAFPHKGTRELTAQDYVYQIKRLADPQNLSPIFGLMSHYIVGLSDLSKRITQKRKHSPTAYLDLRQLDFDGAKVMGRYRYRIRIHGLYPQFIYWLSMTFFSPLPWEAERFYAQPGLAEKNISLAWHPVGTGPYQLIINNPNRRMVLARNPHFHPEYYPTQGEKGDQEKGYLAFAGQRLPFVDRVIFTLEKESIPRWHKFLQGYYDRTKGISTDVFDQAVTLDAQGRPQLTPAMRKKSLRLQAYVTPSTFYTGFNMKDPLVGGRTPSARLLRRAIAIAFNQEEYIALFLNGRGQAAQSPIPPILPNLPPKQAYFDPYVYQRKKGDRQPVRRSLAQARKLLKQAGYPNGINPKTGQPLLLHYDTTLQGSGTDKARFDWLRKQFNQLGITLQIRATQYNRFQQKLHTGNVQLFSLGWIADYADPENFLFLFYGPNAALKHQGPNYTNYDNPQYNALFETMRARPAGPRRQQDIAQLLDILHRDAPWIWGYHPIQYQLDHAWIAPNKTSIFASNLLKYLHIDPAMRLEKQRIWNRPHTTAIGLGSLMLLGLLLPGILKYYQQESRPRTARFSYTTPKNNP